MKRRMWIAGVVVAGASVWGLAQKPIDPVIKPSSVPANFPPVTVDLDQPSVGGRFVPDESSSFDDLLKRLEEIRAEKASVEKMENALVDHIRKKAAGLNEKLKKAGIGEDKQTSASAVEKHFEDKGFQSRQLLVANYAWELIELEKQTIRTDEMAARIHSLRQSIDQLNWKMISPTKNVKAVGK